jgi:hypothetical protein
MRLLLRWKLIWRPTVAGEEGDIFQHRYRFCVHPPYHHTTTPST